jgi:NitT/TauT family transport system substrate-binding protein
MQFRVIYAVFGWIIAAFFTSAFAQAPTKITVLHTGGAPYMASFVAKDQGFFAKRGLDVDFKLAQNGSIIIAALVAGSAQIGLPTVTVILQAVDNGLDVVLLACNNQYPEKTQSGLLARSGSNIHTAKDLEGKKVGVPGIGGFLDVVLRKWLADNGVDARRVNFVETTLAQSADILKSGNVDAVASLDPFLGRAVAAGVGYVAANYTSTLPAGTITGGYTSTRAWAEAHPQAVIAFREALLEALDYIKDNEASARESLVRYTGLPPQVVASLAIPNLAVRVTPEQMQFWIDVSKQQNLIQTTPNPARIVWPWGAAR